MRWAGLTAVVSSVVAESARSIVVELVESFAIAPSRGQAT